MVLCCGTAEGFMNRLLVSWKGTFNQMVNIKSDNSFWVATWRLLGPAILQCGLLYIIQSFIYSEHSNHWCLFAAACTQSFCEFREWIFCTPEEENSLAIFRNGIWVTSSIPQILQQEYDLFCLQSLTFTPSITSRLCCNRSDRVLMRKQSHWLHSCEKWRCYIFCLYKYKIQVTLFCLHSSTWLKRVTLKDTVKEGANRKQFHHKEGWNAVQESTNNSWIYKGKAAKKEHPYLFPVTKTGCLLFLCLRWLKMGTKTVKVTALRKGVCGVNNSWTCLWHLISGLSQMERGKTRMERTCKKTGKMTGELRFWCQNFAFSAAYLWENKALLWRSCHWVSLVS